MTNEKLDELTRLSLTVPSLLLEAGEASRKGLDSVARDRIERARQHSIEIAAEMGAWLVHAVTAKSYPFRPLKPDGSASETMGANGGAELVDALRSEGEFED